MLYFKHHSNMRNDIKMKRVISKFGLEGYGLYCLMVESITESLSEDSPMPNLQETCEDIACFYNGNTSHINEVVNYMINQGLFELDELSGAILCQKIYKFLDTSSTKSEKLRNMIKSYKTSIKESHGKSELLHDEYEEEIRREEEEIRSRRDKEVIKPKRTSRFTPPLLDEVKAYCLERKNSVNAKKFHDYYTASDWHRADGKKVKNWKQSIVSWEGRDYGGKKGVDQYNMNTGNHIEGF